VEFKGRGKDNLNQTVRGKLPRVYLIQSILRNNDRHIEMVVNSDETGSLKMPRKGFDEKKKKPIVRYGVTTPRTLLAGRPLQRSSKE